MTVSAYAHEKIIMFLVFVALSLLCRFDGLIFLSIRLLNICSIVLQDGGTDISIPAHAGSLFLIWSQTPVLTVWSVCSNSSM